MKRIERTFLVGGCLLCCHPSFAQEETKVLQELRRADADFRNGAYSASARIAISASSNPSDGNAVRIQKRHAIMSGSKFEFTEIDSQPNGKLILQQRAVFDGKDKVRWIGTAVDISRGAGDSLSPILGLVSLQPGPCLFQGRGLSSMRMEGLVRDSVSSLWILKAQAADGSHIKAWLDPNVRFLARRIERFDTNGKQLLAHIRTEGSLGGGLLPARSKVWIPPAKVAQADVYTFFNAQFPTNKKFSFQGTFYKPVSILDSRLGSAVSIEKKSNTPTSLAQLLVATENETRRSEELKQAENAAAARQLWMNRALMSLPVLAAVLILLWRPRKKKVAREV